MQLIHNRFLRWMLPSLCGFGAILAVLPRPIHAVQDEPEPAPIELFNGKDLSGFSTYLGIPYGKTTPVGINRDPQKVFSVVRDGEDTVIRISGEIDGGLITTREFNHYSLSVEYKWGKRTYPPREEAARTAGVFVHCQGVEGAHDRHALEGIKVQIQEGSTGDLIPAQGRLGTVSLTGTLQKRIGGFFYTENGPSQTLTSGVLYGLNHDPDWKDRLGFRGKKSLERPAGEWNTLIIACPEQSISVMLGGVVINRAETVSPHSGKILLQSKGAEWFIRKLTLQPLPPPIGS
jgi:hypothetical protein